MAKEGGGRKSESRGGNGLVQTQRKVEAEKNRETEPQIRVMDNFGGLFNLVCCEVNLWTKVTNGREVCIQFHSKGDYVWNCSRSHAPLIGQIRVDYIWFIRHCRAGYETRFDTWKRKSGDGGVRDLDSTSLSRQVSLTNPLCWQCNVGWRKIDLD